MGTWGNVRVDTGLRGVILSPRSSSICLWGGHGMSSRIVSAEACGHLLSGDMPYLLWLCDDLASEAFSTIVRLHLHTIDRSCVWREGFNRKMTWVVKLQKSICIFILIPPFFFESNNHVNSEAAIANFLNCNWFFKLKW